MSNQKIQELKNKARELESQVLSSEEVEAILPGAPDLKKLKSKELLFIHNVIQGMSSTDATLKAGYKDPSHGSKILKEPHIEAELERRLVAAEQAKTYKKENLMSELFLLIHDANQDIKQDRRTILTCFDMIAKLGGFYQPDTVVNVQNNLNTIKIEIVKPNEQGYTDIE